VCRNVLLPHCVLSWPWLWWRVKGKLSENHELMRWPYDASYGNIHGTAGAMAYQR
jgi:hypothetical protein